MNSETVSWTPKREFWTEQENMKLSELVAIYGTKNWKLIAEKFENRNNKQCREHWHNQLSPQIKRTPWTLDEEKILDQAHAAMGNKWSKLSLLLPGRPPNVIKNHKRRKNRNLKSVSNESKETVNTSQGNNEFEILLLETNNDDVNNSTNTIVELQQLFAEEFEIRLLNN